MKKTIAFLQASLFSILARIALSFLLRARSFHTLFLPFKRLPRKQVLLKLICITVQISFFFIWLAIDRISKNNKHFITIPVLRTLLTNNSSYFRFYVPLIFAVEILIEFIGQVQT